MAQTAKRRPSPVTGVRVATFIVIWLGVAFVAAPRLGLYYITLAAWYTVPPLVLIYVYCLANRGRTTALLAALATVVAAIAIGFAIVIPKGGAA